MDHKSPVGCFEATDTAMVLRLVASPLETANRAAACWRTQEQTAVEFLSSPGCYSSHVALCDGHLNSFLSCS